MKLKSESLFLIFIGALIVGGLFLLLILSGQSSSSSNEAGILVREDSFFVGNSGAEITLVEFGDFQCPACQQAETVLDDIREKYADKVKIVFRHFPLPSHRNAILAAEAAESAGAQGKFWEYHDLLYQKQGEWSNQSNAQQTFLGYAGTLGLDTKQFEEDLKSNKFKDKINKDKADGIDLGVSGTPTFSLTTIELRA